MSCALMHHLPSQCAWMTRFAPVAAAVMLMNVMFKCIDLSGVVYAVICAYRLLLGSSLSAMPDRQWEGQLRS